LPDPIFSLKLLLKAREFLAVKEGEELIQGSGKEVKKKYTIRRT
jgi:hypothetical protein